MHEFSYYQPTRIHFGWGIIKQVDEMVKRWGKRCLLVTGPVSGALHDHYEKIKAQLKDNGIRVEHFSGVVPNPTTESIGEGSRMARDFSAEVVLGMGGGSSMDSAKAIAVEAVGSGPAWQYRIFGEKPIPPQTLPVLAVSTTSGTGSQVTAVAVLTNPAERFKSALVHPLLFPKECVVDPELMLTLPPHITASTGFDVFSHSFESYIHKNANPYTDLLALEAIQLTRTYLPKAIKDGLDRESRIQMAWADTLGGLCIANSGTTLPHGIGMAVGGSAPHVMHGEALAVIYPEFLRFTWKSVPEKFATLARIFDPSLRNMPDMEAAGKTPFLLEHFLEEIGLKVTFRDLGISQEDANAIVEDSLKLPDYTANPRIPTKEEIGEIVQKCL